MGRQKIPSKTAKTIPGKPWLQPFQPGQSGNPAGRPVAARQRLTEKFISDLSTYYQQHGAALIERVAIEQPAMLIQVIAKLLPRDVAIQITQSSSLTPEQQRRIAEAWIVAQADSESLESDYVIESADTEEPAALPAEPALLPTRVEDVPGEIRDAVDDFERPKKQRRAGLDRV